MHNVTNAAVQLTSLDGFSYPTTTEEIVARQQFFTETDDAFFSCYKVPQRFCSFMQAKEWNVDVVLAYSVLFWICVYCREKLFLFSPFIFFLPTHNLYSSQMVAAVLFCVCGWDSVILTAREKKSACLWELSGLKQLDLVAPGLKSSAIYLKQCSSVQNSLLCMVNSAETQEQMSCPLCVDTNRNIRLFAVYEECTVLFSHSIFLLKAAVPSPGLKRASALWLTKF